MSRDESNLEQISQDFDFNVSELGLLLDIYSVLIVEGIDDSIFFRKFASDKCYIAVAGTKERVIRYIYALEVSNPRGMLGIIDDDFDRLIGRIYNSPNIISTQTHDLESLLLKSPALENVLYGFGFQALDKLWPHQDIREPLLKSGATIGYIRWVSLQYDMRLNFEKMPFQKFIDGSSLSLDETAFITFLITRSKAVSVSFEEVYALSHKIRDTRHDAWLVTNGHDLLEILAVGIRRMLDLGKGRTRKHPDTSTIETNLRHAFDSRYFETTELYKNIVQWEQTNEPYKILKFS